MTDLDRILTLWREVSLAGMDFVLATVVEIEGSGYRKPGARMLVSADGRRAGTISGGCLEGEVARKAFWHTENGAIVRRYSTRTEDGEVPFGMGCGGVVHLLLERSATASPLLERLAMSFADRRPMVTATVLEGGRIGERAFLSGEREGIWGNPEAGTLSQLAKEGFGERRSFSRPVTLEDGEAVMVRVEWHPARTGIFVFGAGDDALPLVGFARQLGWFVMVTDGRSHLATRARFGEAHEVFALDLANLGDVAELDLRPGDVAVVMTHSLEQDEAILAWLLNQELAYIGVLGPRRRTVDLLSAIAAKQPAEVARPEAQIEVWLERLKAPMGLDLGGDSPAEIALAVIAEMQHTLRQRSGRSLSELRRTDGLSDRQRLLGAVLGEQLLEGREVAQA
jgi:xanthine/CO dehydrogenase XdhC/CoxF family maturation factor